jgi:hypothetical protein
MEIWKTDLQDGDIISVLVKGLGGYLRMISVFISVYDKPKMKAIIPEISGPLTISSFLRESGIEIAEEDIPLREDRRFYPGEHIRITGKIIWHAESGDRIFEIHTKGSDKLSQIREQIERIWKIPEELKAEVDRAIEEGWSHGHFTLPSLPYLQRSFTRDILGWSHKGVIEWSEHFKGAALLNIEKLTELWGVHESAAQYWLRGEWSEERKDLVAPFRFHPTLRKGMSLSEWEDRESKYGSSLLKTVELTGGYSKQVIMTVGMPIEEIAEHFSKQVWFTITPDQMTVKGHKWKGIWKPNLKIHIPSPWKWIIEPMHQQIELNPDFLYADFVTQLRKRDIDLGNYDFEEIQKEDGAVVMERCNPAAKLTSRTLKKGIKTKTPEHRSSKIESAKQKKRFIFTHEAFKEVDESVQDLFGHARVWTGYENIHLIQSMKGPRSEEWWLVLDTSEWFDKCSRLTSSPIRCKFGKELWYLPSTEERDQDSTDRQIWQSLRVTEQELKILWKKGWNLGTSPSLRAEIPQERKESTKIVPP